jgi:sulfatase maturation enzyme AslB (radical SAM superfamily)
VQRGVSSKRVLALLDRWHRKVQHSCRDCWCLPICNVGCFATIGENGTISSSEAREACALNRQRMDQLLRDYCSVLEENPHAFDYAEAYEFQ